MRAFSLHNPGFVAILATAAALPLSNLYAHWTAGKGVASAGGLVSQWTDQISGLAAYAPAPGYRPSLASLGGHPALLFSGAQGLKVDALDLSATKAMTIAVVIRAAATGATVVLEHTENYNSTPNAFAIATDYTDAIPGLTASVRTGPGYQGRTLPAPTQTDTLLVFRYDATAGGGDGSVMLYANDAVTSPAISVPPSDEWLINAALHIGSRAATGGFGLNGYLADILVYRAALSDAAIATLRAALNHQYTLNLS
ncbi:MAG: hypothetical protein JWP58_1083 [Hymenobacter sp.]|nr:hypothetical protein [Hymenobacter sp.]